MGRQKNKRKGEEQEQAPRKKQILTEQQLMDKSHMDKTDFIPLITKDSLYQPYTFDQLQQAALKKIVMDLNHLLYQPFKTFWATLLYNPHLRHCLSSCLSHLHRRWLNPTRYSPQSRDKFQQNQQNQYGWKRVKDSICYEYIQGITKIILMIFHRIVSYNQQNKQLAQLYKVSEQISKQYILDLPRLLELAQIYGSTNPDIVRYIIKRFLDNNGDVYQQFRAEVMPLLLKNMGEVLRMMKTLTERQEYGVNYSYKRLQGQKYSQGEQQMRKKITNLMTMLSFTNTIHNIINLFPSKYKQLCYFQSQIQSIMQNTFLELQAAYKTWNYQQQQTKLMNLINSIISKIILYFNQYFNKCHQVFILNHIKVSTFEAYLNGLNKLFVQFGRRQTLGRKGLNRNLLMYKIINKQFKLVEFANKIMEIQQMNDYANFNPQFLKEFIINMENQFKEEYINQQDPRQEEVEEETQAGGAEDQEDNQQDQKQQEQQQNEKEDKEEKNEKRNKYQQEQDEVLLQTLVPKRMRSQDYYAKLYQNYNFKYYKGEYDDDYDDMVDYDKRPLFYDQPSSDSESQTQNQRRLVSNTNNMSHVRQLHMKHTISRDHQKKKPVYQAKFVQQKKPLYEPKIVKLAPNNQSKYVQKNSGQPQKKQKQRWNGQQQQSQQQQRGGKGYKKSNKSYNYKPKDNGGDNNRGRNTNKKKEYEQKKTYKPKN